MKMCIGLNCYRNMTRVEKALCVPRMGLSSQATGRVTISCLLQDAGSQQVGFLLGSCGVTLALTTDACQKGLPKAQTGEVATFKGGSPRLRQVVSLLHCVLWSFPRGKPQRLQGLQQQASRRPW